VIDFVRLCLCRTTRLPAAHRGSTSNAPSTAGGGLARAWRLGPRRGRRPAGQRQLARPAQIYGLEPEPSWSQSAKVERGCTATTRSRAPACMSTPRRRVPDQQHGGPRQRLEPGGCGTWPGTTIPPAVPQIYATSGVRPTSGSSSTFATTFRRRPVLLRDHEPVRGVPAGLVAPADNPPQAWDPGGWLGIDAARQGESRLTDVLEHLIGPCDEQRRHASDRAASGLGCGPVLFAVQDGAATASRGQRHPSAGRLLRRPRTAAPGRDRRPREMPADHPKVEVQESLTSCGRPCRLGHGAHLRGDVQALAESEASGPPRRRRCRQRGRGRTRVGVRHR
jgi:hypothetical protein